ncbi:unnamed protein product [Mucor circinelloides]
MVSIKDRLQQPSQQFSSPIISPDNELGYYLHVPPFDHGQDQPRLAIASIDEFSKEIPKVYEVRSLYSDCEDSPPLFSPSINTSASTLEELRMAERQVFQQTCPETFETIQSVYDSAYNRQYHFNKLRQMMSYYENGNKDNISSGVYMDQCRGSEKLDCPANSSLNGLIINPPPRQSSKSYYYNSTQRLERPSLKRYDSSKIVRYTLVDQELSHTKSTSSSYHQRLNEYDDDTHPANTNHPAPAPLAPSYHPTLHPKLLTASSYDYWTTSDSSNASSSRDSKCSSQYQTTNSNYSITYNQRNQRILEELGYSPSKFNGIQDSVKPLEEKEVSFYLRSPKQELVGTDSKQSTPLGIPYFTYLSTLIMIAYFAGCLIKNYQLTGAVIQLSPFNVMVGPSAETLIYTGARFTPCIRASSLYPANEMIYTCPRNPAPDAVTRPTFNDQSSVGIFARNKTRLESTCNLQNVCGGNSFNDALKPDQGYRFISALFMHSGIVQLIINMLVHIRIGLKVEKRIYSARYATIWLISGIFGYVFGSLFVPEGNISTGCSVPLMGVMAFLCVDLVRYWHAITCPARVSLCIIIYFAITLAIGLLPGYDNFSHFGGFIGGTLITLATLPMSPSHVKNQHDGKSDQFMLIWLVRMLMLAFIAVLMWMLVYLFMNNGSQESCHACQYFSCLPFSDLCSPYT